MAANSASGLELLGMAAEPEVLSTTTIRGTIMP